MQSRSFSRYCRGKTRFGRIKRAVVVGITVAAILVGAVLLYARRALSQTVAELAVYQVSNKITQTVGEKVKSAIDNAYGEEGLLKINRDEDGNILDISADAAKLSEINAEIINSLSTELSNMESERVRVPQGAVFGMKLFSGSGAEVEFSVRPAGKIEAQIEDTFEEAGINQVKYTIKLVIKADIMLVISGKSEKREVGTESILAQTVLAGRIPDAYIGALK